MNALAAPCLHPVSMLCLLFGLVFWQPSQGDEFDALRGKRVLSSALANSAVEYAGGEDRSTPRTPEQLLLMFLISPRHNAYLWEHPETWPSVMDRMAEPGFLIATFDAAMHPEAYLHFLNGWTDLEKMRSYFEMMDPALFLAWATVVASPASYQTTFERMARPQKLRNWADFALGSRWLEMMEPVATPRTYTAWLTLPINPDTSNQMQGPLRMFNPMQPLIMMNTLYESGTRAMGRFTAPAMVVP